MTSSTGTTRLRIVSYNIQAAIGATAPSHYVTRLHRQFVHTRAKDRLLARIGAVVEPFDIACLQEIDLGGRRAGFESQVDRLFEVTSFTEAAFQENRIVRRISRHGNLVLTRREMDDVHDLKLPARMGGRGALVGDYPVAPGRRLSVVNLHLSLGTNDRVAQVEHVADALRGCENVVVCGDFNAPIGAPGPRRLIETLGLKPAGSPPDSYPSWKPRQAIDHILVSRHIRVEDYRTLETRVSDHLPVAATLVL